MKTVNRDHNRKRRVKGRAAIVGAVPINMSKGASALQTLPEEIIAAALNEQGFLFAQAVREEIRGNPWWRLVAGEYPVTGSDDLQTRIDIVLANCSRAGTHMVIECKRANPLYKRWVVFDKGSGPTSKQSLFIETIQFQQRPVTSPTQVKHCIEEMPVSHPCEVFASYVEAALNREKQISATRTIEDAFQQIIRGHTGLMTKLIGFGSEHFFQSIPVIVTTAQLYEASFDHKRVSLRDGTMNSEDLKLKEIPFCAVNVHSDDKLRVISPYLVQSPSGVESDLRFWLNRTVFVVQSGSVSKFLGWAHEHIVDG